MRHKSVKIVAIGYRLVPAFREGILDTYLSAKAHFLVSVTILTAKTCNG